jgi:hypothetical protein
MFLLVVNIKKIMMVSCCSLLQANLANVREFKQGMKDLHTDKIANFTAVLIKAFELLQHVRNILPYKSV